MTTEKPITTETVALTEKKMDMSLDEIIKMSKSNTNVKKGKKQQRLSNKNESSNGAAKNSAVKAQNYIDSRTDVRQGAFAKNRSNFQGNQFPVTTKVARRRPPKAVRMANTNQPRFITPPVQNRSAHRGFVAKEQQRVNAEQKQANGGGQRQLPQTLDARFASMKEERMRMTRFTQKESNVGNYGYGSQHQQRRMVTGPRRPTRFPN